MNCQEKWPFHLHKLWKGVRPECSLALGHTGHHVTSDDFGANAWAQSDAPPPPPPCEICGSRMHPTADHYDKDYLPQPPTFEPINPNPGEWSDWPEESFDNHCCGENHYTDCRIHGQRYPGNYGKNLLEEYRKSHPEQFRKIAAAAEPALERTPPQCTEWDESDGPASARDAAVTIVDLALEYTIEFSNTKSRHAYFYDRATSVIQGLLNRAVAAPEPAKPLIKCPFCRAEFPHKENK